MNKPYGGDELTINLPESEEEQKILTEKAEKIRSLHVPKRFLSDCEMLSMGAFSPLDGFMSKEEVDSVLDNMELTNGLIWGIPIILLASEEETSA
ncbi:MAG: sulfate adenylyltransferase, partial [Actinomycetia bacterium]|nr:sulfate adenylyltransferase [Actinomycetes bacterium]